MSGQSDLEVALKLKAQTEGKEQIDALGESLSKVGEKTPENLKEVGQALDTLGTKAVDGEGKVDGFDQSLSTLGDEAADGLKDAGREINSLGEKATDSKTHVGALDASLDRVGQDAPAQIKKVDVALDGLNAALTKSQPAAINTGKAIQEAFGVLGVRSAAQIQAEIREVDIAVQRLGMDAKVTGQDFDRAWSASQTKLAALHAELNGVDVSAARAASGAKGLGSSMGALGGIASSVGPMIVAAFGAQHFIEANTQAESLRRCLVQMTGSQQAAGAEMEYVKATANRLGLELQTTSSAYMSLYASTKGTALEGEQTRRIFEAVSGAMGTLGKSSAETQNALMAVSQMASKGTVSMEELRGQLGEALPGALKAAADGMGVSTQKLIEMVSSGDVLAKDLLPKLADGLEKTYGTSKQVDGLSASFNRLKNSVSEAYDKIGQAGGVSTMTAVLDSTTLRIRTLAGSFDGAEGATKSFGQAVKSLSNPLDFLNGALSEGAKKALLAGDTFGLHGKALDNVRHSAGLTQAEIDRLNGQQTASVTASHAAAQASVSAANAEQGRAVSAQKMTEALRDSVAQTERAAKASGTYAEAIKQNGANAVAVAQMFGTEAEARAASAQAADDYAAAVKKDLANQEQVLAAKRLLLAQLQEEASKSGELSQKKQEEIKALEDGIAAQTAAVAKAKELADASDMAARKSELAAETYGNQSARLEEYARVMEIARQRVEELKAAEAAGSATKEQVKAATLDLGEATARYRDALSDATQAASLHVQQLGRQASLEQAQLGVVKARYQAIYEVARAQGREREAAEAMAAIRKIEIQMQEAQAKAARAQAAAIITAAKAKEAELAASGKLTEAAKAEIDARIQEAEVKKLEAEKAEILVSKLRELANTTDDVRSRSRGATDGLRDSLDGATAASERLNTSLRNRPGTDTNPVSAGNQLSKTEKSGPAVYSGLQTDWEKVAMSQGLRGEQVTEFMKIIGGIVKDEEADSLGGYHTGGDADGYGNAMAGAFKRARDKAVEQARQTVQRAKNAASGNQDQGSFSPGQGSSSGSASSQTVNHVYTVRTPSGGSVNVSSESDAQTLIAELQRAYGTSSIRG